MFTLGLKSFLNFSCQTLGKCTAALSAKVAIGSKDNKYEFRGVVIGLINFLDEIILFPVTSRLEQIYRT